MRKILLVLSLSLLWLPSGVLGQINIVQPGQEAPLVGSIQGCTGCLPVSVVSALATGGATELKQDDIITQLVAILAKILSTPATELKQDDIITALADILTEVTTSQTSSEPVVIVVGDTPTLLFSASSTRRAGFIQNTGTAPVFLGKGAVTTTTGEILAGSNVANNGLGATAKAEHGDTIFAIAATGTTVNVRVSEVSQ